jgi:hypothetical protein
MKVLIFSLILLVSTSVHAQKIAVNGENIAADKMNSSIAQIGEIKQALLTQAEFQQLNGDCWVGLNGQSISGSDYANFTGRTTLPDANCRFLRNAGGEAAALGQTQEDEFKSHNHGTINGVNSNNNSGAAFPAMSNLNNRANVNTTNTGGTETRPKNLTVNLFIKINKQFNFN